MVLVCIITHTLVGGSLPDLVMVGSPWAFIRTQCIGGHVDIVMDIVTVITEDIIVVTTMVTEPVMPEVGTIREIDTRIDQEHALQQNPDLLHVLETVVADLLRERTICTPIETVMFIKEIGMAIGRNKINAQLLVQVLNLVLVHQHVRALNQVQGQVRVHQHVQVPSLVLVHQLVLLLQVTSLIAITRTGAEERRIITIIKGTGQLLQI